MLTATQNPVEQEGTYPLPEAQVDRFMLKVVVDYPSKDEEISIMKRMEGVQKVDIAKILTPEKITELRQIVSQIFVDDKLYDYVANLVFATRSPELLVLKS